jgi:hypothetical protein
VSALEASRCDDCRKLPYAHFNPFTGGSWGESKGWTVATLELMKSLAKKGKVKFIRPCQGYRVRGKGL